MIGLNSPSRVKRGAGGGKQGMREVKSGIFLSDPFRDQKRAPAAPKTFKVVRTKSGNLLQALVEEEQKEAEVEGTTKVTSRFARVLLAGSGFLADAYDLFVINLVLRLLRNEYPEYDNDAAEGGFNLHALEGGVAAAALVGAIIGQLVAGSLADVIGRKKIFVATALLISIGSFGSAFVGNSPTFTVYGQLAAWRFCLGAGVGGEYPLAATVTSESSSAARRGALMAGVFSMQGVGSLLSVLIVITCLSLGLSDAFTWRFALAFGAVPVLIAFPWRLRMHETETFQRVTEERQACAVSFAPATAGTAATASVTTPFGAQNKNSYGTSYGATNVQDSRDTQNILSDEHYSSQGPDKTNKANTVDNSKRSSTGAWIGNGPGIQNLKTFRQERSKNKSAGGAQESGELEMQMVTDCVEQDNTMFDIDGERSVNSDSDMNSSKKHSNAPRSNDLSYQNNTSTRNGANNTFGNTFENTFGNTFANTMPTTQPLAPPTHAHKPRQCEVTRMGEIQRAFKYYKWHMLGTSLCWFLLDVDFYANGLFNHEITSSIFSAPGQSNSALQDAYYTLILSVIAIPGYYLSVLYIDTVGRKNLQMLGFSMMCVLFLICSLSYEWLMDASGGMGRKYLFLLIYALTFLFSNFGPNTTSFVIPGEIFPAEVRATCHGISAASGKLGAATGAYLFPLLLGPDGASHPTTEGIRYTMLICSIVAALGTLVTYLFIPQYDAEMLVEEGSYLALDQACLRPCDADLLLLDGYELVEVEEGADVDVV